MLSIPTLVLFLKNGINGAGPQRIVTGNGGEIYYTPDHYQTFIRLDQ